MDQPSSINPSIQSTQPQTGPVDGGVQVSHAAAGAGGGPSATWNATQSPSVAPSYPSLPTSNNDQVTIPSLPNGVSAPSDANPSMPPSTNSNLPTSLPRFPSINNSQPPSASSQPNLSQHSSSSASVDALLTAAASQPSSQPASAPAPTPFNGDAPSVPTPSISLPPASAIPQGESVPLSPLKVEGQSGSSEPTSISVGGGEAKAVEEEPVEAAAPLGTGNGEVNGTRVDTKMNTVDSGFVDGPSMATGAPGTVDAATHSVSSERLIEGENPLPSSVSPSLVPAQQPIQSQPPPPSASPAPIPPPVENLAPTPSPVPQPPAASIQTPIQSQEPASSPAVQPPQPVSAPSEDVKMTDGTLPSSTPAAMPTPPASMPAPSEASQQQSQAPVESPAEPLAQQNGSLPVESSAQTPAQQQNGSLPPPAAESTSFAQPPAQSQQPAYSQPSEPQQPQQPQEQQQQPAMVPSPASAPAPQPQVQDQTPSSLLPPPVQPLGAASPAPSALPPAQPAASAYVAQPDSAMSASAPSAYAAPPPQLPTTDSEPPSKRQRFEGEGNPIVEMSASQIKFAQNSIKALKGRPESGAFHYPVDPMALNIPQYTTYITQPADLGTIDYKLALTASLLKSQQNGMESKPTEKTKSAVQAGLDPKRDVYRNYVEWEEEVRRVFSNCRRFNGLEHPLSKNCDSMERTFDKQMSSFPRQEGGDGVVETEVDKKIRRPSNPIPTIRRSSDDAGGRPKREIHPPPPKDMPYWEDSVPRPSGSSSSKRKAKSSAANSAAERAHQEKVNRDELRFCDKVIGELLGPKHAVNAWVFYDLVDRNIDFGAAYYQQIKRPIALNPINNKMRNQEYEDKSAFDADMQLLFKNCFTFNPPGTDVYVMGQKLKNAYEARMRQMPRSAPFIPQDQSYYEDDEDDEGEEMANQIRQQIENLQNNLAQLEGSKTKNPKAIANTKASLVSMQSSAMTKPVRSKPPAPAPAPAPVAAAPRKSGGSNGKAKSEKKKSGGGVKRKNPSTNGGGKKKYSGDGSEEDIRIVTYEQKEELAAKITELPDDRLDGALRIIAEDKPHSANDEEEIELDIDDLKPGTLYKLYKYVVRPKKPRTSGGGGSGGQKKKGGKKGGNKRGVLDEEAEAKRIASLQTQLSQFDSGVAQNPAAGGSGAHDDLIQSDSSGSDSDSDSDDDAY